MKKNTEEKKPACIQLIIKNYDISGVNRTMHDIRRILKRKKIIDEFIF